MPGTHGLFAIKAVKVMTHPAVQQTMQAGAGMIAGGIRKLSAEIQRRRTKNKRLAPV